MPCTPVSCYVALPTVLHPFPPSPAPSCQPISYPLQFEDVLGRGACKVVYKAFDTQEGTEVAWNQVRISDLMCTKDVNKEDRDRLFAEIRVLKALKHKNIMSFYDSWYDPKTLTVNFITELFTSGTLRQYRKRHKHVDAEVLKRWAWQILCGLVYLHGHNPPIIHRDLKCDNIFINGSDGVVKIGDLGLATMLRSRTAPQSVLGTPEFMAPELYEEDYDDRVDVYAFGMALLELATLEYPYAECSNAAQIYRKVMLGVRPAALQKITDRHLAEFINTCIAPRNQRPLARQLLKHPYFDSIRQTLLPSKSELSLAAAAAAGEAMPPLTLTGKEDGAAQPTSSKGSEGGGGFGSGIGSGAPSVTSSSGPSRTVSGMSPEALAAAATTFGDKSGSDGASLRSNPSNGSELASAFAAVGVDSSGTGESGPAAYASSRRGSRTTSPAPSPPLSPTSPTPSGGGNSDNLEGDGEGSVVAHSGECHCAATQRCFQVNGKYREVREKRILSLRLRIKERDGAQRTVEFEFDTNTDTAVSVASEMVSDLELSPEDADTIVIAMGKEISALTQSLEPKASTSLQAVGAALQQGLVENALLQANEGSGVLPQAAVPPVFQERLPSVSEAGEPAAPAEGEEGQVPSPAPQLPRDGSTLSVNSEESAASVHSAHSAMSIRSSPAQLTATAESSLPVQRSVSPPQPGSAPGPHHMMRTLSVDRTFRHVALPPGECLIALQSSLPLSCFFLARSAL